MTPKEAREIEKDKALQAEYDALASATWEDHIRREIVTLEGQLRLLDVEVPLLTGSIHERHDALRSLVDQVTTARGIEFVLVDVTDQHVSKLRERVRQFGASSLSRVEQDSLRAADASTGASGYYPNAKTCEWQIVQRG